jgi:hypothetical protein
VFAARITSLMDRRLVMLSKDATGASASQPEAGNAGHRGGNHRLYRIASNKALTTNPFFV